MQKSLLTPFYYNLLFWTLFFKCLKAPFKTITCAEHGLSETHLYPNSLCDEPFYWSQSRKEKTCSGIREGGKNPGRFNDWWWGDAWYWTNSKSWASPGQSPSPASWTHQRLSRSSGWSPAHPGVHDPERARDGAVLSMYLVWKQRIQQLNVFSSHGQKSSPRVCSKSGM